MLVTGAANIESFFEIFEYKIRSNDSIFLKSHDKII